MENDPKLRLVVSYADGRETSFPLAYGRYTIGSAGTCHIRIESDKVAQIQAVLIVDEDGVSISNLDLHGPYSLVVENTPIRERTAIEENDLILLGPFQLKLIQETSASADQVSSPDGTVKIRRRGRMDLQRGLSGYRRFQHRMAPYISAEEAHQADLAFEKARKVFGLSALVWLISFSSVKLLIWDRDVAAYAEDFLFAGAIVMTLVLVSLFHIRFAGRLILPVVSALLAAPLTEPQWATQLDQWWLLRFVGLASFVFATACLFDYGASTWPERNRPALRRYCLALFSLVWLTLTTWWFVAHDISIFSPPRHALLFSALCLCGIWGWWPAPQMEKVNAPYCPDTCEVLSSALLRWSRALRGRTLAMVCGFFPFFLFFNLLGFQEQIDLSGLKNLDVVRVVSTNHLGNLETKIWYWGAQGRLLATNDIRSNLFVLSSEKDSLKINKAVKAQASLMSQKPSGDGFSRERELLDLDRLLCKDQLDQPIRITNEGTFSALVTALEPYRIGTNIDRFLTDQQLIDDNRQPESDLLAYFSSLKSINLSSARALPQFILLVTNSNPEFAHVVDRPTFQLIGESHSEGMSRMRWFAWLYLLYGILGIIFLWRRGGDSWLAFWIGLWLLAWACSGFRWWSDHMVVPAVQFHIWQWALELHLGSLASAAPKLFHNFTWLLQQLDVINLPFCAILVFLYWPPQATSIGHGWRRAARYLVRLAAILVCLITIWLLVYNVLWRPELQHRDKTRPPIGPRGWSLVDEKLNESLTRERFCQNLATSVSWFTLVLGGSFLRRMRRQMPEAAEPVSEVEVLRGRDLWPWLIAYLGFSCMRVSAPWFPLGKIDFGRDLFQFGFWLALGSVLFATYSLLRRNFMGICRVTEASYILVGTLVPIAHEFAKDGFMMTLKRTTFFSERGVEILAILLMVVLLKPLWKLIEWALGFLLNPALRRIEKAVGHSLEAVADAETNLEKTVLVEKLFSNLKVQNYALYVRSPDGTFVRRISQMVTSPVDKLPLSPMLRKFLGLRRRFVDLQNVALERRFYFHQFELCRIEHMTGCRYVLPICLGSCVRGLLFLAHGSEEETICKDAIAEEVGAFGAAAIHA